MNLHQLHAQDFADTVIPKVSIISANAYFVNSVSGTSNENFNPVTKKIEYVEIHYHYLIYELKFKIALRKSKIDAAIPLDIRLTFSNKQILIMPIEDDISDFIFNDIYDYDMEIHAPKNEWVTFEIGEFYYEDTNITYDRTILYFSN